MKRKFDESLVNRHPAGTSKGGEFAEKGAEFIGAVKKMSQQHPFDRRQRLIGEIGVEVVPGYTKDSVYLQHIRNYGDRGHGSASGVLKRLTSEADRLGVRLELSVEPTASRTKGLSAKSLKSWYERHGFKGGDMGMYRPPRTKGQKP